MDGFYEFGLIAWTFLLMFLLILPIVALISILRSDFKGNGTKLIWVIIVILVPIFGSVIYFAFGRKQRVKHI